MSYEGRSPCNDVMRSVVMGAAMLSPALLEACSGSQPENLPPTSTPPDPTTAPSTAATGAPSMAVATAWPSGQPVTTHASERPRGNGDPTSHPTRGFRGGARGA